MSLKDAIKTLERRHQWLSLKLKYRSTDDYLRAERSAITRVLEELRINDAIPLSFIRNANPLRGEKESS